MMIIQTPTIQMSAERKKTKEKNLDEFPINRGKVIINTNFHFVLRKIFIIN
jgi:hypothetical protein